MENNTHDTDVPSTTTSLVNRAGNSLQPSERAVARLSTLIDMQSSEKIEQALVILMSLLQGMSEEIMSGDMMYLACSRALRYAVDAGVPEAEAKDTLNRFMAIARQNRQRNPLSSMF